MDTTQTRHYLVGRYVTHQPDGVHAEARCSCGVKLEGVGEDESLAINSLWRAFTDHTKQAAKN